MDCRIRLLGQKRMFYPFTSVFDLEVCGMMWITGKT
jgi:hypothetical protein